MFKILTGGKNCGKNPWANTFDTTKHVKNNARNKFIVKPCFEF